MNTILGLPDGFYQSSRQPRPFAFDCADPKDIFTAQAVYCVLLIFPFDPRYLQPALRNETRLLARILWRQVVPDFICPM
jgi:hypothetical protein